MMRTAALVLALLAAGAATPTPTRAQLKGVRFEVTAVGDTTVTFLSGTERWVKPGLTGIAINPLRRDVLVARLRLIAVERNGRATALVTGQTTSVTTDHVVLLQEPALPWFRRRGFWSGLALGAVMGVVAGTQF